MILPRNITDWPEDWQEQYEKRAAIMEYYANIPRDLAEKRAETVIRRQAIQDDTWEPIT